MLTVGPERYLLSLLPLSFFLLTVWLFPEFPNFGVLEMVL